LNARGIRRFLFVFWRSLALALATGDSLREGRQKKNNDNPTYICASSQLAKKSTFSSFFAVRIWAFLGKGSSKTRKQN
jgi:hypothetical protein